MGATFNKLANYSCKHGYKNFALFLVPKESEGVLAYACYNGYIDLVKLMIEKGARNWNRGLTNACFGGHKDIAELMIELATGRDLDWNEGLHRACYSGNKEVINLMILNGANFWNYGLAGACHGGHKGVVDLMILKGAKNWKWGLDTACMGGHKHIATYMIEKGANIDKCDLSLFNHHIYYLVQKGIIYFGKFIKYQIIANAFITSQKNLPIILEGILNNDLISIILTY